MLPPDDPAGMLSLTSNTSVGLSCLAWPVQDPAKAVGTAVGAADGAALTVDETGLVELVGGLVATSPPPWAELAPELVFCITCTITTLTATMTTMAAAMASAPDRRPDEARRRPPE